MEILFFAAVFTRSLILFDQRLTNLLENFGNFSVTLVNIPNTNESWTFDFGILKRIDLIDKKILELDQEKKSETFIIFKF